MVRRKLQRQNHDFFFVTAGFFDFDFLIAAAHARFFFEVQHDDAESGIDSTSILNLVTGRTERKR